ncbi:MAG: Heavy metal transport/detoxification protein [Bryobacterales bacterium]|jgi:copper chaperone CopZ|nr:Heavy metal transport/detoxification protein [Bryobacterales bacterium]
MTCAFAVRGALKKFAGVESVEVSLNKGLATVKLKPGNKIRPQEFWEAVKNNGFTPKDTTVVVRGDVQGGKLTVSGTNQVFELSGDTTAAGKTLTLRGALTPQKDLKAPVPLQVRGGESGR